MINRIRQIAIPDAIKRILGLTVEPGVGVVADELQFSADLYQRREFWALMGGDLASLFVTLAAGGVGFRSQVAWNNPAGSGEIGLIEHCFIHNSSAGTYDGFLGISRAALAGTVAQLARVDLRGTARSVIQSQQRIISNNTIALAGLDQFLHAKVLIANEVVDLVHEPIVIGPGWNVRAFPNVDNNPVRVTFSGRVRRATAEELELGRG